MRKGVSIEYTFQWNGRVYDPTRMMTLIMCGDNLVAILIFFKFYVILTKRCDVIILLLRRVEGTNFGQMLFKYMSTNIREQNSKTFSSLEDNFGGT